MAEDSAGNVLGRRGVFVYESDTGLSYNMRLDRSVAEAVGNDTATNASLPNMPASQQFPLRPRYILLEQQNDPSVKKRVIIGDIENALYQSNQPSVVTINGVPFVVTTRVGERRSVLKLDPPPAT